MLQIIGGALRVKDSQLQNSVDSGQIDLKQDVWSWFTMFA